MNLIRKLSSGLRSSQEVSSSAVKESWENESDREEDEDEDEDEEEGDVEQHDDDADVFLDATHGQQQQQERGSGEEEKAGVPQIRVRAPISEETDHTQLVNDDGYEEAGEEEGDGYASFGSGESYDSAFDRHVPSSSTASFETASSRKAFSPVGSWAGDPSMFGNSPPSGMQVSQQGALMRLNEMLTGDASLDTSILDKSTGEEFIQRISQLAESRGQSVNDASFSSIVDALLPLVLKRSEQNPSYLEPEDDVQVTDNEMQIPRPRNSEEGSYLGDDDRYGVSEEQVEGNVEGDDSETHNFEVDVPSKVDEEIQEKASPTSSESVPNTNDGEEQKDLEQAIGTEEAGAEQLESPDRKGSASQDQRPETEAEQSLTIRAMPMAKLTAEDEGDELDEDRDDDEAEDLEEVLDDDGADEQVEEEMLEGKSGDEDAESLPLKIRATLSDAGEGYELPHSESSSQKADSKEEKILPNVKAPASDQDKDSRGEAPLTADPPGAFDGTSKIAGTHNFSEELEETSVRPIAKLTVDDTDLKNYTVNAEGDESVNVLEERPADQVQEYPSVNTDDLENTPDAKSLDDIGDAELADKQPTQTVDIKQPGETDRNPSEADAGDQVKAVAVNVGGEREEPDEVQDSDEEVEEDDEEGGEEEQEEENGESLAERSSALAALVGAAHLAADTPSLGAAGPTLPARPTRRSSAPSLEPAARVVQQPRSVPAAVTSSARDNSGAVDGNEETREKLQVIRVKFLRLALRLGQSAHNVVVAQVLYRLGLAEQLRGGGHSNSRSEAFSFDRASAIAEEQEAAGPEELDFTCTIMVLGKTGVGKSATINSIFDEPKAGTNAFNHATNKVQVITGNVHGIKVRVIDTPGLRTSLVDQRHNEKIMASVKRFIRKQPPDIVLYFDRLDMQSHDYGDFPVLRTITDTFGAAVWFNAIVVLTHASSAPPDGPNGLPLSYEVFVARRSHFVQQTIRQAAGDMRLMNPVSLVENHPACRVNRARQRVLPNGQVWKPQLLLLCFASKVLAEANSLLKLQDNTPSRPFGARTRIPPLPFLLSSLLQSRAQLKLPDEQVGGEDESDEELEEDSDEEEEDYDQLPPFRRLAKDEVTELDKDNRDKYFEELAERERLFQKKQWKEEKKRRRDSKRMTEATREQSQRVDEGVEDEMERSAAVPVPMPDMVLPPSFDSDEPSHRYRYLETSNQWLVRPVLETHGWDHDYGYDGMSVEKLFAFAGRIPASVSGQVTKDKKEANVNMECAASLKHGEGKVTLTGLDVQTVGKDLAYTLRSETRFSNFKGNKTTGGLAVTLLGDTTATGMKIENRLLLGKRLKLVLNSGAITGRGDVAYGGSLEATLRDKDYPLSRTLSTLGISVIEWHGDLAIGGDLQSQVLVGKTMMVGRANLNNRGAGQISIRASSSEQLQMALIGLLPIIRSLANRLLGSQSQQ